MSSLSLAVYNPNDLELISSVFQEEKDFFESISKEIWSNPELKFEEFRAHKILTEALRKYGFDVRESYVLPTAFRAEFKNYNGLQDDVPTVAFLCEYDALPGIGHACGHNLIAQAGLAAAVSVKTVLQANPNLVAKVVVLGCPAEEGGGGKIHLIEKGAFSDVDAALMVHPTTKNAVSATWLNRAKVEVTFKGIEAHASARPWEGRNALDAAVACYVNISLLRQQMKPTCRLHGIITNGGQAPNVIPGEAAMEFFIRAIALRDLEDLKERIRKCFDGAAQSSGCKVEYKFHDTEQYASIITNSVIGSLYRTYSEMLGVQYEKLTDGVLTGGSTDMGNVSRVVPSIHALFKIGDHAANHTKGFAEASGDPAAQLPTITAAKTLALVGLRIIRSSDVRKSMKEAFAAEIAADS